MALPDPRVEVSEQVVVMSQFDGTEPTENPDDELLPLIFGELVEVGLTENHIGIAAIRTRVERSVSAMGAEQNVRAAVAIEVTETDGAVLGQWLASSWQRRSGARCSSARGCSSSRRSRRPV